MLQLSRQQETRRKVLYIMKKIITSVLNEESKPAKEFGGRWKATEKGMIMKWKFRSPSKYIAHPEN